MNDENRSDASVSIPSHLKICLLSIVDVEIKLNYSSVSWNACVNISKIIGFYYVVTLMNN